jgi:threonine 3-dehydrogenase
MLLRTLRTIASSGARGSRGLASSAVVAASAGSAAKSSRVLVTGANGQIGLELVQLLRSRYGGSSVVATDLRHSAVLAESGPFAFLDVTDRVTLQKLVVEHNIDTIVHLASLLSGVGEKNPQLAIKVNAHGSENVLEVAAQYQCKVFAPSTIAVFGPTTPRDNTPNTTILRPTTIYGSTKVYMELLGEYYNRKFGVDFRSIRYPGIISNKALPGGGTTDYAVEIYYEALKNRKYTCFLGPQSALPMMYMPDCLRGTLQLIEAPAEQLTERVYNLTALSFTPADLAVSIKKYIPDFEITYAPDFRQAIADSWPRSIDDSKARADWGWKHEYDTDAMTRDMLKALAPRLGVKAPAGV